MGADNSKSDLEKARAERELKQTLENQRRMFEKKSEELRKAQSLLLQLERNVNGNRTASNNVCAQTYNPASDPLYPNLNYMTNNNNQMTAVYANTSTSCLQSPSTAHFTPALPTAPPSWLVQDPLTSQITPWKAQVGDACPSTSSASAQTVESKFRKAQVGVTGPSTSSATAQTVKSKFRKAQVGVTGPSTSSASAQTVESKFRIQAQQQLSQSPQTFPSTSSGTARSGFKTEKSQSKPQTRIQAQQQLSQSPQTFPSTSSGTARSGFKTEKSQSKPQTRNSPQCDATLNIVKCVTCNDALGIRIYQCKKGHSSCAECRIKNAKCGLCPELVSDMRNLALETHIADIILKERDEKLITCPNAASGCRLSLKTHKIENHANECPFREMACPLRAIIGICTWKGKQNQLIRHFKEEHQEHMGAAIGKEMYLLNIDVNHKIVQLVNIGAFHFLVHFEVNNDQRTICMTVQSMSTKISASKWSYELHVYNKSQPRRKFQLINTCFSNSESVQEIFTKKNCAVLSLDYARTFLDNERLSCKFYIKKKID